MNLTIQDVLDVLDEYLPSFGSVNGKRYACDAHFEPAGVHLVFSDDDDETLGHYLLTVERL